MKKRHFREYIFIHTKHILRTYTYKHLPKPTFLLYINIIGRKLNGPNSIVFVPPIRLVMKFERKYDDLYLRCMTDIHPPLDEMQK